MSTTKRQRTSSVRQDEASREVQPFPVHVTESMGSRAGNDQVGRERDERTSREGPKQGLFIRVRQGVLMSVGGGASGDGSAQGCAVKGGKFHQRRPRLWTGTLGVLVRQRRWRRWPVLPNMQSTLQVTNHIMGSTGTTVR